MIEIEVKQPDDAGPFVVTLTEGGSSQTHHVGVPDALYQKLTGGKVSKADCVKASFRFLLDRESRGSIMSRFYLPFISTYFPEYESRLKDYL